jgi:hypothetical protein
MSVKIAVKLLDEQCKRADLLYFNPITENWEDITSIYCENIVVEETGMLYMTSGRKIVCIFGPGEYSGVEFYGKLNADLEIFSRVHSADI